MSEKGCIHGKGSETTDLIPANHLFCIHLLYRSQMLKTSPFETYHFIFSQLLAKSWTTGQNRIGVRGNLGQDNGALWGNPGNAEEGHNFT